MEDNLIINENATVVYSETNGVVYSVGVKNKPTTVKVTDDKSGKEGKVIPWGDNNDFPQVVLEECRKNTIVGATIDKKARIAYEAGLAYGVKKAVDGEMVFTEIVDERVELFIRRSKIHRYLISAYRDFYWFYNAFPELVLSTNRDQILSIKEQKTAYCRWGGQNSAGVVEKCYINADWENAETDGKGSVAVAVIDIYALPEDLKGGKDFKYIYPISYPTEDETFYSLVDWNSVRESGWLDVAQAIPEFKKNLFKNQLNIKYHLEISSHWWNERYPGFDGFNAERKRQIYLSVITEFEKKMKGNESSGNSIMTTFYNDPNNQKEYAGWRINAIDDKVKSGVYIDDSNEASSHILFAMGMDPALLGLMPGSKLGGNSGSNKRVAFNIESDLIWPHQELILEPLNFIAEYNDWRDADGRLICFWHRNLKNKEEPASNNAMTEQQDTTNEPPQQAS
jgi:hypothetical protein